MGKIYKTIIAISALSLAMLQGCGGGGGGSGGGDTTQPTPKFVNTQIDTAGIEPAFVQVAFNETGQAVVLWRQLVFLDTTLFANLFDPVSGWGPAQKVSSAPSIVVDSQLSMDGNGDVVVIWDQTGSPPRRIVANTLISGVAGNTHTIGDGLGGERVHPRDLWRTYRCRALGGQSVHVQTGLATKRRVPDRDWMVSCRLAARRKNCRRCLYSHTR